MITALYTDGGVIKVNPSPIGGTWAYALVDEHGQRIVERSGVITPTEAKVSLVTNNHTELLAIVYGLQALPDGWRGTVYSDSWISLQRVFLHAALNNLPRWLIERLHEIQRSGRLKHVSYVLLDGHPTKAHLLAGIGKRGSPVSEHNVFCDRACQEAGQRFVTSLS
jgi:ribonuclease HI